MRRGQQDLPQKPTRQPVSLSIPSHNDPSPTPMPPNYLSSGHMIPRRVPWRLIISHEFPSLARPSRAFSLRPVDSHRFTIMCALSLSELLPCGAGGGRALHAEGAVAPSPEAHPSASQPVNPATRKALSCVRLRRRRQAL